jgi:hypothetical protein
MPWSESLPAALMQAISRSERTARNPRSRSVQSTHSTADRLRRTRSHSMIGNDIELGWYPTDSGTPSIRLIVSARTTAGSALSPYPAKPQSGT